MGKTNFINMKTDKSRKRKKIKSPNIERTGITCPGSLLFICCTLVMRYKLERQQPFYHRIFEVIRWRIGPDCVLVKQSAKLVSVFS
jgi:hypothetical protein